MADPQGIKIDLFYGICLAQGMVTDEANTYITLASNASANDTVLYTNDTTGRIANQLISYYGTDNKFHTVIIDSVQTNVSITLKTPLVSGISNSNKLVGQNVGAWWISVGHPTAFGGYSMADYALAYMAANYPSINLNTGVHLFIGDSWIYGGLPCDRVVAMLPGISGDIRSGVNGNKSADVIARFATDVTPYSPNFVWVNIGVNDSGTVSPATFQANITTIIDNCLAIGAQPILWSCPPDADYYVKCKAFADNTVYTGTIDVDIASATIDASRKVITVTGENFGTDKTAPANIEISLDGVNWTEVNTVDSISDTTAVGTFAAALTYGKYSVRVTEHGGYSETLTGGLTVPNTGGVISDLTLAGVVYNAAAKTLTATGIAFSETQGTNGKLEVAADGGSYSEPAGIYTWEDSLVVLTMSTTLTAGKYAARITNGDGELSSVLSNAFATLPTISSISPIAGKLSGTAGVEINGSFGDHAGCSSTIGGNAATITAHTLTKLTVTVPSHAAGATDVVVTDSFSQSTTATGGYNYVATPSITSLSPTSGSAAGGTSVDITGTFPDHANTGITIGGVSQTITGHNATTITITTAAHAVGALNVVATDSYGQTDTKTNGWTYTGIILATSASYSSLLQQVTVNGSGFGASKGTGKAEFSLDGSTWIEPDTYNSWAATQISGSFTVALADGTYRVRVTDNNGNVSPVLLGAFSVGASGASRRQMSLSLSLAI